MQRQGQEAHRAPGKCASGLRVDGEPITFAGPPQPALAYSHGRCIELEPTLLLELR